MGERKTPQEMRCGNAKKRSLSSHGFYGRKTEDFGSDPSDSIEKSGRRTIRSRNCSGLFSVETTVSGELP